MTSSRRRKGRKQAEEPHASHERWAISYMDMVTVVMCLFIVLFAISQVDQQKFEQLSKSLGAALGGGATEMSVLDGSNSILDGQPATQNDFPDGTSLSVPELEQMAGKGRTAVQQAAEAEIRSMKEMSEALAADLKAKGLEQEVELRITPRGLIVGLVTENVFFRPLDASLSSTTEAVLDTVAPRLKEAPNELSIEGHANILPTQPPYETNWELSSDRATKVARRLVEVGGIAGNRVQAVGMGDKRPLATGNDEASLAKNRRVDVVVGTTVTGEVQQVMEQLLEKDQATGG